MSRNEREPVGIFGVPMDLGQDRRGVDMGPSAIRYAQIEAPLEELGHRVTDLGNAGVPIPEVVQGGLDASVADGAGSHIYASTVLAEVHRHTEDPDRFALVLKQRPSLPNVVGRPPPRSVRPVFV